jgi:hypothetical protein
VSSFHAHIAIGDKNEQWWTLVTSPLRVFA